MENIKEEDIDWSHDEDIVRASKVTPEQRAAIWAELERILGLSPEEADREAREWFEGLEAINRKNGTAFANEEEEKAH